MASDDIWYFLKGQETVGPFSKGIIQQIYEGGQFAPETMVWRDGMAEWKPAGEVAELADVFVKKETPSTESPATAQAPAGGVPPPKLKLKAKEPAPEKPATSTIPPPLAAVKPAEIKQAGLISETEASSLPPPVDPAAAKPEPQIKDEPLERAPLVKRIFSYVFSSLFMAPLFAIICGAIVWFHQDKFPNILFLVWMILGFGIFGVLSFVGIRALNGLFDGCRFSFWFLPFRLLWPVIMGELSWKEASIEHWILLGFCAFYGLTMRFGLRDYPNQFFSGLASIMGIIVLLFMGAIAQTSWTPPGWDKLLAMGAESPIPSGLPGLSGKSQPKEKVGTLCLDIKDPSNKREIMSAKLKLGENGTYCFAIETEDRLYFSVETDCPAQEVDFQKVVGKELKVSFQKDLRKNLPDGDGPWVVVHERRVQISSATLRVDEIQGNVWRGALKCQLGESGTDPMVGSFEATAKK